MNIIRAIDWCNLGRLLVRTSLLLLGMLVPILVWIMLLMAWWNVGLEEVTR